MGVTGPRRLGAFEVWLVDSGRFRLDGGAMFGVVPRALWEKRIEPDHRNRVWLSLNCLLVRTPDETVLIEAGIGDKLPRKKQEIYSVEPGSGLLGSLSEAGVAPEDVDHVVLTHLHMDHAGGATVAKGGAYVPTFPRARYVVQEKEWNDAVNADGQTAGGYFAEEDLLPLERAGVLELVEGEHDVCGGIRVFPTPGHTRAHQSVRVTSDGETVCFIGDLVPMRHHMRPIYIMAFDLYPKETYRVKQEVLAQASREGWWVVFPHESDIPWGRVGVDADENFSIGSVT